MGTRRLLAVVDRPARHLAGGAAAGTRPTRPTSGRALEHAELALRLWRGPVLQGVQIRADLTWPETRAATLRRQLEVERGRLLLEPGRPADVEDHLVRTSRSHPLDELLHRLWMTALARQGRRPDALVIHEQLRERLAHGLGTAPDQQVRQLHTALPRDQAV